MPQIILPSSALVYQDPQEAMAFLLQQSASLACMAVRVDSGEVLAYAIEEPGEKEAKAFPRELVSLLLNEVAQRIPTPSEKIALHFYATEDLHAAFGKSLSPSKWQTKLQVTGLYYPARKEANSVLPSNRLGSPPTPYSSPFIGKLFKETPRTIEELSPMFVGLDYSPGSPDFTSSSSSGKSSRSNTEGESEQVVVEETEEEYAARIRREDREYVAKKWEEIRQMEIRAEEMEKEAEEAKKEKEEAKKKAREAEKRAEEAEKEAKEAEKETEEAKKKAREAEKRAEEAEKEAEEAEKEKEEAKKKAREAEKRAEEAEKEAEESEKELKEIIERREELEKRTEALEKSNAYLEQVYHEQKDNPVFWDLFRAEVERVLREQASASSSEETESCLKP